MVGEKKEEKKIKKVNFKKFLDEILNFNNRSYLTIIIIFLIVILINIIFYKTSLVKYLDILIILCTNIFFLLKFFFSKNNLLNKIFLTIPILILLNILILFINFIINIPNINSFVDFIFHLGKLNNIVYLLNIFYLIFIFTVIFGKIYLLYYILKSEIISKIINLKKIKKYYFKVLKILFFIIGLFIISFLIDKIYLLNPDFFIVSFFEKKYSLLNIDEFNLFIGIFLYLYQLFYVKGFIYIVSFFGLILIFISNFKKTLILFKLFYNSIFFHFFLFIVSFLLFNFSLNFGLLNDINTIGLNINYSFILFYFSIIILIYGYKLLFIYIYVLEYLFGMKKNSYELTKNELFKINIKNFYNEKIKYNSKRLNFIEILDIYDEYIKFKDENLITPIIDKPIELSDKDILNFNMFSENLFNLIKGISNNRQISSYSIGLVGEWGTGKSSIINLLTYKYLKFKPEIKVLNFNPWNFEKDDLIKKFFDDLSLTIGLTGFLSIKDDYLNALGEINGYFKILKYFKNNKTTEELKNELNKKLEELKGRKVLVIIDDLDRCNSKEILTVLNIVKNLGNLSNIIYLVSYDKKKIIEVLENEKLGGDYLDKIINFERYLPLNTKVELKEYFESELGIIFTNIGLNFKVKDIKIDFIFENENLRFIKKLLNQLNIILQLNKEYLLKLGIDNKTLIQQVIIVNSVKLKKYDFFVKFLNYYIAFKTETTVIERSIPEFLLNFYNNNEDVLLSSFFRIFINIGYNNILIKKDSFYDDLLVKYN